MTEPAEQPWRAGSFDGLEADEPYPGVVRRVFDTPHATVTRYDFAPGARFPQHRHPQEQITLIEDGTLELRVSGESRQLAAGDWAVVAPDVEHGITAGESGAGFLAMIVPRRANARAYTVVGEQP